MFGSVFRPFLGLLRKIPLECRKILKFENFKKPGSGSVWNHGDAFQDDLITMNTQRMEGNTEQNEDDDDYSLSSEDSKWLQASDTN